MYIELYVIKILKIFFLPSGHLEEHTPVSNSWSKTML